MNSNIIPDTIEYNVIELQDIMVAMNKDFEREEAFDEFITEFGLTSLSSDGIWFHTYTIVDKKQFILSKLKYGQ